MKSGKNLLFLPQYSILYNYSHENLFVRSEVYMMVTVVNSVLRDMVLLSSEKFLNIYPPNYEASYPRGHYSFNSLENFYKDLLLSLRLIQIFSPCINMSLYVGNLKVGYYVLNLKVTL